MRGTPSRDPREKMRGGSKRIRDILTEKKQVEESTREEKKLLYRVCNIMRGTKIKSASRKTCRSVTDLCWQFPQRITIGVNPNPRDATGTIRVTKKKKKNERKKNIQSTTLFVTHFMASCGNVRAGTVEPPLPIFFFFFYHHPSLRSSHA